MSTQSYFKSSVISQGLDQTNKLTANNAVVSIYFKVENGGAGV